jgi:hypothetical protein
MPSTVELSQRPFGAGFDRTAVLGGVVIDWDRKRETIQRARLVKSKQFVVRPSGSNPFASSVTAFHRKTTNPKT